MKVDLKARYQTMAQVVEDLEKYLDNLATKAAAESRKEAQHTQRTTTNTNQVLDEDEQAPGTEHIDDRKRLLCVEVQPDVQDAFRKTLSKMGYRVILVADAERAAERYVESPTDAILFDADGLGPHALDAFMQMHDKAHEDGHDLAAVVLLGPKQHYLAKKFPTNDRLVVLPKPVKMKEIQGALNQLAPTV